MKKKGIYKGLATLLSICIGLTVGFPLNATKVQAAENLVVQPSNEVSLSRNGNIYTFGNDLIKSHLVLQTVN